MRAAVMTAYGPAELLTVDEVEDPTAAPGQIVVDIKAAAVNFPDLLIMSSGYQISWPLPLIPGSEFAGTVRAVGEGVEALQVGDRVAGTTAVGAFAERVVGMAAIDIAKLLGARVIAVAAGENKLAVCRARGADAAIDYSHEDLKQRIKDITGAGANVVIDPVGGRFSEEALRATAWGGRFVCLGFAAGEIPKIALNLVLLKGVIILGMEIRTFGEHRPDLAARDEAEAFEHFAAGRLRPYIEARIPLADTYDALVMIRERKAIGKVVITA